MRVAALLHGSCRTRQQIGRRSMLCSLMIIMHAGRAEVTRANFSLKGPGVSELQNPVQPIPAVPLQ